MASVTEATLQKDLDNVIEHINQSRSPIYIKNDKGKGAVLVGEDTWAGIEETLYLQGTPGMAESIASGRSEPLNGCAPTSDVGW